MHHHPREDALVHSLYDSKTGSFQYVIADPVTRQAAIIDPVLDFDEKAGHVATTNADALLAHVEREGLEVVWILDTHPHADHLSAAPYLKERLGTPTAIGEHVTGVQALWKDLYALADLATDGSQWDRLFADGDSFAIGALQAQVLFSPGHTMASISYVVGRNAFVHDTLMMPDSGTSRADFPGGDAHQLYGTLQRILALPDDTALFVGHDYGKDRRAPACMSTVAEQRARNIHLAGNVDEAAFVHTRQARDATLPLPALMLHALQVNMRGGRLPEPEANGRRYLRIPLGQFTPPAA
ncbi:beta-lactamase [Xanthomonas oryzae]|nr:MBL fold metallo-hydrolase [Xanthomonas oryzae pv. oryzae]KOR44404.1 beta-lactamase [Xanthomonas oryzae]AUI95031.1 MBL fold metallo-hydrolase [Xanthomonas oryzae pv. oryzae]AUI98705.1 MBL fold metallo-hydrolase [Xanthomonas oryzae pv. oryzae]AUJ02383.1 MBL fold metallo-hydrolase [Xanthomonas oryzae pv. oryzae]